MTERVFSSASPEATEHLAELLGELLAGGDVVTLDGDLGAGKTCFARGLARGLGVTERVSSPTFQLMNEYAGRVPVHHFDAWMEGRERAFLEGGGDALLFAGGVAVIEWAERVAEHLPAGRVRVLLEHESPTRRRIRIQGPGTRQDRPDPVAELFGGGPPDEGETGLREVVGAG